MTAGEAPVPTVESTDTLRRLRYSHGRFQPPSGSRVLTSDEPTLLVGADQRSEIVQQEVFGPVLVALPFDDDDEALRLANDVPFGLAASAWTRDVFRAQRASWELVAGTVWINDHIPIVSEMPHGGAKGSGFGKDMSAYSFDEYTQVEHVMSDITGLAHKGWQDTIFRAR